MLHFNVLKLLYDTDRSLAYRAQADYSMISPFAVPFQIVLFHRNSHTNVSRDKNFVYTTCSIIQFWTLQFISKLN